jgi:hypothetical protein
MTARRSILVRDYGPGVPDRDLAHLRSVLSWKMTESLERRPAWGWLLRRAVELHKG